MPQSLAIHGLHSDTSVSKSTRSSVRKQSQSLCCHRTHSPCSLRLITSMVFTLLPYSIFSQNSWNQHQAGILRKEVPCLLAEYSSCSWASNGGSLPWLSMWWTCLLAKAPTAAPASLGNHTRAPLSTGAGVLPGKDTEIYIEFGKSDFGL